MAYTDLNITNANGLPVAEKNQEYFVLFKEIASTTPEIIDKSNFFITYLVDKDGNIYKPSENNVAKYNLLQNFDEGKPVTVIIDKGTSINAQLAGSHNLLGIGAPIPYLYSQNGIPSSSYEDILYFMDPDSSPSGSYSTAYDGRGSMVSSGSSDSNYTAFIGNYIEPNTISNYDSIPSPPETLAASFDSGSGIYTASIDWGASSATFKFTCKLSNISTLNGENMTLQIRQQYASGGPIKTIATTTVTVPKTEQVPRGGGGFINIIGVANVSLEGIGAVSPTSEIYYYVRIFSENPTPPYTIKIQNMNFSVISQNPVPDNNYISIDNHGDYWVTSSDSNSTWITGSGRFSAVYGSYYIPTTTQTSFGFNPVTEPFIISPGDKIRFEYNPQQEYIIYEVQDPTEDGILKLKLNNTPPSQSQMQNFVLYKLDKNTPRNLILDVEKDLSDPSNFFEGIILPQYPSKNISNNIDKILQKLKEDGIIEN